ncbi:hypothetical protein B0H66DRAFT_13452 [Apodospora peruviana]|uniref:Uncharacterized protein n=1 Tax=Apodospora peruviana TaxID=516989 RepID=A0AAE0MET2_9PEZI|nr:hypothetical protein B0H66DRAFT_13452 [Apodospora peruviana]
MAGVEGSLVQAGGLGSMGLLFGPGRSQDFPFLLWIRGTMARAGWVGYVCVGSVGLGSTLGFFLALKSPPTSFSTPFGYGTRNIFLSLRLCAMRRGISWRNGRLQIPVLGHLWFGGLVIGSRWDGYLPGSQEQSREIQQHTDTNKARLLRLLYPQLPTYL